MLAWFEEEKSISCMMPDTDLTVLSYATKRQAHAAYVMHLEHKHNHEYAATTSEIFFSTLNYVDGSEEEEDLHKHSCVRSNDPSQYRYGNILLGLTTDGPVDSAVASYSHFAKIWADDKNHPNLQKLVVRKWIPFAKCDTCAQNREEQEKTQDRAERKRLAIKHSAHLRFVRRERNAYAANRYADPDEVLSVIIDGADASRFALPHFAHASHTSSVAWHLRTHIIGAIVHQGDTYAFTCPSHLAQGHNVTIQVLKEVLVDILQKKGKLPRKLCLQLDNTTKQNKGKYLFSFLALLLAYEVFAEIEVSFLPVGHTHEDIDQFFSRISVYLRYHNAPCTRSLGHAIKMAYTKRGRHAIVSHWNNIANISGFLEPHVMPLKDVTLYYHFRFRMAGGRAVVQARTWPGSPRDSDEDFWRGLVAPATYTEVFSVAAHESMPCLVSDLHLVPPAARAKHTESEEYFSSKQMSKRRRDLELMFDLFPGVCTESARADCLRLLRLELTPRDTPIPCVWTTEDMELLFGRAAGQHRLGGVANEIRVDSEEENIEVPDQ